MKMPSWPRVVPLTFALAGCAPSVPPAAAPPVQAPAPKQNASPANPTAATREFVDFSHAVFEHIRTGNAAEFQAAFSVQELSHRILDGIDANSEFGKGFVAGAKQALQQRRMDAELLRSLQTFELVTLMGVRRDGDLHVATVRGTGLNGSAYIELIERRVDGELKIVDVWTLDSGKLWSEQVRSLLLPLLSHYQKSKVGQLFSEEFALAQSMLELKSIAELAETEPVVALGKLQALPPRVKAHPVVLQLQLKIVTGLSDALYTGEQVGISQEEVDEFYMQTLSDLETEHGEDPSMNFLLYDLWLERHDYRRALKAVDYVEQRVGQDGFTRLMRSSVHLEKGELPKARRWAQLAVDAEPELEGPYWNLLEIAVRRNDQRDALLLSQQIYERFDKVLIYDDLDETSKQTYETFLHSEEYLAFLQGIYESQSAD